MSLELLFDLMEQEAGFDLTAVQKKIEKAVKPYPKYDA